MHINSGEEDISTGGLRHWAATRLLGFAFAGALLVGSQWAAAQVLVYDRGLPTTNLNNAAIPDRSNIQWSDIETSPTTPWLPGDDFTLAGSGPYVVTTIRVWSSNNTGLSLHGGVAGGSMGLLSNSYTATAVTYVNSESYQQNAGGFLPLYQIDFSVNIPLNGGVTYQFFLDGPAVSEGGSDFSGALLHGSNAALSGSTQQGSDGVFLFLTDTGTVTTWNSLTGAGTYCGCAGWDKVSDGNVQVFAEQAPIPGQAPAAVPAMSAPGLAGLALLLAIAGLIFARGRRRT